MEAQSHSRKTLEPNRGARKDGALNSPLDMWADMDFLLLIWIYRYWTCGLLICNMWNPTSIVPVSRYIVPEILFPFPLYCSMLSTELRSSYHVTRIMYCICSYYILDISNHKANWGMGETRRLIRSYRVMYWIHCLSHCRGRGSAGYRLYWVLVTCYTLSGLALVSAARGLFKAVIPGMHGIHPPDKNSSTMGFQLT